MARRHLKADRLDLAAVREVLKRANLPDRRRRENLLTSLRQGETLEVRNDIAAARKASGKPVYIADPDNPNKIIQVLPHGSRIRGALVNRKFVPDA